MRFFMPGTPIGRTEYALVMLLGLGVSAYAAFGIYELSYDFETGTLSYQITQQTVAIFLAAAGVGLSLMTAIRRLNTVGRPTWLCLLLLVPILGILFALVLLAMRPEVRRLYSPYGDNPYDPGSWIDDAA